MNDTITGKGIIQFHDSMAECEGKESMKCSCTDFLLFATSSPSRAKGNNIHVHVVNNTNTKLSLSCYMRFISHVGTLQIY